VDFEVCFGPFFYCYVEESSVMKRRARTTNIITIIDYFSQKFSAPMISA
jgi:hypothetical protein